MDNSVGPISRLQQVGVDPAMMQKPVFEAKKDGDVAEQFEAFVLHSFVQEMLPKNADSVFGGGLAGNYWRSMLSEKLAEAMARGGDFGIADYLRDGAGSGVALGSGTERTRDVTALTSAVTTATAADKAGD